MLGILPCWLCGRRPRRRDTKAEGGEGLLMLSRRIGSTQSDSARQPRGRREVFPSTVNAAHGSPGNRARVGSTPGASPPGGRGRFRSARVDKLVTEAPEGISGKCEFTGRAVLAGPVTEICQTRQISRNGSGVWHSILALVVSCCCSLLLLPVVVFLELAL